MRKIIILLFIPLMFFACKKADYSCLDMPQHREYVNGSWRIKWAGLEWINMNRKIYQDFAFDVIPRGTVKLRNMNNVLRKLHQDLGQPLWTRSTLPADIEPNCYNIPLYFHPDGNQLDGDKEVYWWKVNDKMVRFDIFHLSNDKCSAMLTIFDLVKLSEWCEKEEREYEEYLRLKEKFEKK